MDPIRPIRASTHATRTFSAAQPWDSEPQLLASLLPAQRIHWQPEIGEGGLPESSPLCSHSQASDLSVHGRVHRRRSTCSTTSRTERSVSKDLRKMPAVQMGQRITTMTSDRRRCRSRPSKFKFQQHGNSGAWISELLPHTAKMVDDIAIIKTLNTEAINHDPAITYICTGHQLPGRASLGSWLSYGLGSANENLPAFVVMTPTWTGRPEAQALFNRLWGSGFLPSSHQGVALRAQGDPGAVSVEPAGH